MATKSLKSLDVPGLDRTLVDQVHTHTVAGFAVSAAWEIGLFEALQELCDRGKYLDLESFCVSRGLHLQSVLAVARALSTIGVVDVQGHAAGRGHLFDDALCKKGLFYWLTRGCGSLFVNLPELIRIGTPRGGQIPRDYRAIGIAARDAGAVSIDNDFYDLVSRHKFKRVADLGCGSAERLIRMALDNPAFSGMGVDISNSVLGLAKEAVEAAGVQDRVLLVQGDAKKLEYRDEFEDVDLVCSFMMGHDLWPREACVESLKMLSEAFPNARSLVICDTYRSELDGRSSEFPAFTLSFEVAHAVMGQYLPTLTEWLDVFDELGWEMKELINFSVPPYTALMHLIRT